MRIIRPIAPAIVVLIFLPLFRDSRSPAARAGESDMVLAGAKVYTSPDEAPIADGTVVIRAGKIAAVGKAGEISVPDGAKMIDSRGSSLPRDFRTATCISTSRINGPTPRIFPQRR